MRHFFSSFLVYSEVYKRRKFKKKKNISYYIGYFICLYSIIEDEKLISSKLMREDWIIALTFDFWEHIQGKEI